MENAIQSARWTNDFNVTECERSLIQFWIPRVPFVKFQCRMKTVHSCWQGPHPLNASARPLQQTAQEQVGDSNRVLVSQAVKRPTEMENGPALLVEFFVIF